MRLNDAWALRKQREAYHATLPDEAAMLIPSDAKNWEPDGHFVTGDRVQRIGKLYKCRQDHDGLNDPNRAPELAPALWELIAPPSETGTRDNPIAYAPGMAVENGKYYTENGVLYLCIRDSGVPLYNALADLVGNYVQIAE